MLCYCPSLAKCTMTSYGHLTCCNSRQTCILFHLLFSLFPFTEWPHTQRSLSHSSNMLNLSFYHICFQTLQAETAIISGFVMQGVWIAIKKNSFTCFSECKSYSNTKCSWFWHVFCMQLTTKLMQIKKIGKTDT